MPASEGIEGHQQPKGTKQMDHDTLVQIAVLLAIGAAWTYVNLKSTGWWLSVVSLVLMLGSLGAATVVAVAAILGGAS